MVAIPTNRIAPVTAFAIATINKLAPGRVILATGTGYTGRNTMGMPQISVKSLREYTEQVQGLLRGEDVLFREQGRERWIRLLHADHLDFINVKDPIQVILAANGPRALKAVGEISDGWVTTLRGRRDLAGDFATIANAVAEVGRSSESPIR